MKVIVMLKKGEDVLKAEMRIYDDADEKEAILDYELLCAILQKKGKKG